MAFVKPTRTRCGSGSQLYSISAKDEYQLIGRRGSCYAGKGRGTPLRAARGGIMSAEGKMSGEKDDLTKLRGILHAALVEVEVAIDTNTHPDWSETKESLLRAIEIVRKMERDSMWARLSKK
jgi:hypothetical protein